MDNQKFFKKFTFSAQDIKKHWQGAIRDFEIAKKDLFVEVRFTYSYQALIKAGITVIAQIEKAKVRSVPGHHVKILEKMSEILGDPDIINIGNAMRMKRNCDLYSGGELIGRKEADDYLKFVTEVIRLAERKIIN